MKIIHYTIHMEEIIHYTMYRIHCTIVPAQVDGSAV